ncbi:MAG: glutathione S-transferase family protein [Alphaproteobacteria bacterium]|nr:glutathione S-transferase family protein [Alphaproteobacteria bacterium]
MKFYDCSTAPSPRRVRIFIAEKGIEIETVEVDLRAGEHLGDAFRAVNPHCTVPTLELDDGTTLWDSNSICVYLEDAFPVPNLMGQDAREKGVIASWNRAMEWDGFGPVADVLRNSAKGFVDRALTGTVNHPQIPELAERGRRRVKHFLAELDRRLAASPYVAGPRYTIADITAIVAVEFAAWIKEGIPADAGHLKEWHDRVAARPGVVA